MERSVLVERLEGKTRTERGRVGMGGEEREGVLTSLILSMV